MEDIKPVKYNCQNVVTPTERVCGFCRVLKPLASFNKCKTGSYGFHNHCRDCQKIVRRRWYLANRESELQKGVIYGKSDACKEKRKKNWTARKSILGPEQNLRRQQEPAKIKARIQRNAWRAIPHNRISTTLRGRIRCALKGIAKSKSTEALLNISFEKFKTYLEQLFQPGMSWDNYGEWHIDHIIPCAHFDLTDPYQQRICFHYLNMRPLWANENIAKGSMLPDLYCETLAKIREAVNGKVEN